MLEFEFEIKTVEQFLERLDEAMADVVGDNPDVNPDDAYSDLVDSLSWIADPTIMREVHRVTGTQSRRHDLDDLWVEEGLVE